MNRVRIVALAAVGLGAAVVIGTQFQQQGAQNDTLASPPRQSAEQLSLAPDTTASAPRLATDSSVVPIEPTPAVSKPADATQLADNAASPVMAPADDRSNVPARPVSTASVVPDLSLPRPAPETLVTNAGSPDILQPAAPAAPAFAPLPASPDSSAASTVAPDQALQAELDNCAVWLVVTPAPAAMLDTSIYAPCDQGQRVSISHAGLRFDARIGDDGQMMTLIPALEESASVSVTFADGRVKTDTTLVPDVATQKRVVLQWQGPATMLLNAYEFGAQYGDAGHINPGHPLAPGVAGHGYLTVLGDASFADGWRAQVYSYPLGQSARQGAVRLEIEAPVTEASCGHPLNATAIEMQPGQANQTQDLEIDMPACDGSGGYVVMPGLLPDLQIALN